VGAPNSVDLGCVGGQVVADNSSSILTYFLKIYMVLKRTQINFKQCGLKTLHTKYFA